MLDKEGITAEVSVGVTYSSLMSAVSLFFTGILVSQYKTFSVTIKVPLIFLIISTFSFIFSATIYTNAGTEISLGKLKVAEKYMVYAKNIMELLGLYLFILATPLVIGAITEDNFLRLVTIAVALVGFILYSQSHFSIFDKELRKDKKQLLSMVIVALTLALYYFQSASFANRLFYYSATAILVVLLLVAATDRFCKRSQQYKPTSMRHYSDVDAPVLSKIILENLKHLKKNVYAHELVAMLRTQSTPKAIRELAVTKQLYVAELDDKVVGLAVMDGAMLVNIYTDPGLQRKGIGRIIAEYVEQQAIRDGQASLTHLASKNDHDFYKKIGYRDVDQVTNDFGPHTLMSKMLAVSVP